MISLEHLEENYPKAIFQATEILADNEEFSVIVPKTHEEMVCLGDAKQFGFCREDGRSDFIYLTNGEFHNCTYFVADFKKTGEKLIKNIKNKNVQKLIRQDYPQLWEVLYVYLYGTEEKQIEAVKKNVRNIEFFENPSEAVQLEAVKENGRAIQFIKNPSEAVQLEAVKEDGRAIQFIKNPSEAVQLEAVKYSRYLNEVIEKPYLSVQKLYQELYGQSFWGKNS